MTNEIREKSFDCVKWTREVRDRHYEETKDMSFEEWRRWLDERLSANPLMAKMKERMVEPSDSRRHDHEAHGIGDRDETQVTVEITRDEASGGYMASAMEGGIHVQGGSVEEVRANVKAAVDRYLDDTGLLPRPKFIRLRFVRDEVIEA